MAKIRLSRVESSAFKNSSYAGPSVRSQTMTISRHRHVDLTPTGSCVLFCTQLHRAQPVNMDLIGISGYTLQLPLEKIISKDTGP